MCTRKYTIMITPKTTNSRLLERPFTAHCGRSMLRYNNVLWTCCGPRRLWLGVGFSFVRKAASAMPRCFIPLSVAYCLLAIPLAVAEIRCQSSPRYAADSRRKRTRTKSSPERCVPPPRSTRKDAVEASRKCPWITSNCVSIWDGVIERIPFEVRMLRVWG